MNSISKGIQSSEEEHLYIPVYSRNVQDDPSMVNGLTTFMTTVFIVGQVAGTGMLALPNAMVNVGWIGIVLLCILGMLSGICGVVLGKSWLILRNNSAEYPVDVRSPYPALGFHAYGRLGKYVVVFCINATLIGACTVLILLASDNLDDLIEINLGSISTASQYRIWLVICILIVLPLSWLGTPKSFWPIAIFAILASTTCCLLVTIKISYDFEGDGPKRKVTFASFCSAFGPIAFSFAGSGSFPTLQADMRHPNFFHVAVVFAYFCVLVLYIPIAALGYFAFGDNIQPNVLKNLGFSSPVTKCAKVLISVQPLLSFVIVINPVSQQLEQWLNVPAGRISVKRCIVRSCLVLFTLAIAQGIPNFGLFLDLVGSSTGVLLTFVFPCLFYLKLENGLSLPVKVILIEILGLGCLAGVTSTYYAICAIVDELGS